MGDAMEELRAALQHEELATAGHAVASELQDRIGMSAFVMLRCSGPVVSPEDLFALNGRVSAARVRASMPDMFPLIERELEPFACALRRPEKSFDVAERFPADVVRRSEIGNEYWRPFGVERQLVGHLAAEGQLLGLVCAARSGREAAFTPRDLRAFEEVRGAVEHALMLARRLGSAGLEDALAVLAKATLEAWLLFDAAGHLLWLTDEARLRLSIDALRCGPTTVLRHSDLLERIRAWVRLRARAGGDAAARGRRDGGEPVPGKRIVARDFELANGRRLFLVGFEEPAAPIPHGADADRRAAEAVARAARMARPLRLTPRQAEVLSHLAQGKSNKAIAAALGCAEATVELHVTAVLAKLACGSRAEAIARFWTG